MDICSSCGSIAPTKRNKCGWCNANFETHRIEVQAPTSKVMAVVVEGEFTCRSCGKKVPLNHHSTQGYLCGNCGTQQEFAPKLWSQILRHAHNVADLTGFFRPSNDEHKFWDTFIDDEGSTGKMFKGIGKDNSCLSKGQSSFKDIPFEMDVAPGHPLCNTCNSPLELEYKNEVLHCQCGPCNQGDAYINGSTAKYPKCVGLINKEHRSDSAPVKSESSSQGAVIALNCPNCNGALDVEAFGSLVSCPFCNTRCHVPSQLFTKISGKAQSKKRWWLVFEGESKQRTAIQNKVNQQKNAAKRKEQQRIEREKQTQIADQKRRKQNLIIGGVVAGIGLLAGVAVLLFF